MNEGDRTPPPDPTPATGSTGSAAAPTGDYPTVHILQAAIAQRDAIRRSFEGQRAALEAAIRKQRQAVTDAVALAQRQPVPDTIEALRALIREEIARQATQQTPPSPPKS